MDLQSLKRKIEMYAIVSFDIFDTLLIRPYAKPTDLFFHIEAICGQRGFADARIEAEQRARIKNPVREEVTFEQIYAEMPDRHRNLQTVELTLEEQTLRANPEMLELYRHAHDQKKEIIIISDMYLPGSFLGRVLRKNGFDRHRKLYISADIGKTKASGTLFRHIVDELQASPDSVLHIGDNRISDVERPREAGICGFLYPKPLEQMLAAKKWMRKAAKLDENSLSSSIALGLSSIHFIEHDKPFSSEKEKHDQYWRDIGYCLGGVVCYGYLNWISGKLVEKEIKNVLFVARDGYSLQKMFSTAFNRDNRYKPQYVYASRQLKEMHELGGFASDEYSDAIMKLSLERGESAVVDTVTMKFSAHRLLCNILTDRSLTGFYWHCIDGCKEYADGLRFEVWFDENALTVWNLVEFLLTAPTPPIAMLVDAKPLYQNPINEYEKIRISKYSLVSDGMEEFSRNIVRIFGDFKYDMSKEFVVAWLNSFTENLSAADETRFKQIKHAADDSHSEYHELFAKEETKREWYLLGFIPLITAKISTGKTKVFLFRIFPIMKVKTIRNKKRYYLFFIIPLIKIKRI